MGKFLKTKYSGHQGKVIKKSSKSIQRCTTGNDEHHKPKVKRKLHSKDQEPPLKKLKTKVNSNETKREDAQNQCKSELQDLEVELRINKISHKPYLKLIRHDEDLFSDDDLKAR